MQHLSIETLAALVDHERPDADQTRHLEQCAVCRAELEALRAQGAALAALPPLDPPRGAWPALEARLAEEGLIEQRRAAAARPWWARAPLGAAAALILFAAGGATGAAVVQARGGTAPVSGATDLPPAGSGSTRAEWAANGGRSADEAAARLRGAEAAYVAALAHYQEVTGGAQPADPIARLAALEGIVLTTRAALDEAPADPVINGYHLAALGQRDAMLRQIVREGEGDDLWF